MPDEVGRNLPPRAAVALAAMVPKAAVPQVLHYRIVGSGPVALACALFMTRAGIDAERVSLSLPPALGPRPVTADRPDHRDGAQPRHSDGADLNSYEAAMKSRTGTGGGPRRMLAISDGSRQLLSRVIVMPAGGLIERIEVAMSGRSGRTRIEARDFDVRALGHVISYPDLVSALRIAAARLPTATADPLAPAAPGTVTIHADGLPRHDASAPARIRTRDFRQAALLTEVMAEQAGTTAYECFGRQGPLALLPCAGDHNPRYAIVWCDEPELTRQRASMSPERISAALTEAVAEFAAPKRELGSLRVCGPVEVAPLSRLQRIDSVAGSHVWIGNAAQALHPVAGQGLNLGLRDAFELARSLADNEYGDRPLAPEQVLASFAGRRRLDRAVTTGVTDVLAAAFGWPLARPLQSALLTAMDLLPPLRRPLASTLLFGRR